MNEFSPISYFSAIQKKKLIRKNMISYMKYSFQKVHQLSTATSRLKAQRSAETQLFSDTKYL